MQFQAKFIAKLKSKAYRFAILLLMILGVSGLSPLWSQNCPVGGTTIYFGNGVGVDELDAEIQGEWLDGMIENALSRSNSVDRSCINYKLAYDTKFVNSNNAVVANFLAQVAQAEVQTNLQAASKLLLSLSSLPFMPSKVLTALANYLTSGPLPVQGDLATMTADYSTEKAAGNKIILVAHSQGNLYGNAAYAQLFGLTDPIDQSRFAIVSVATPASFVAPQSGSNPGPNPWVTLDGDIITAVPQSLPPNTTNPFFPGEPCSGNLLNFSTSVQCHFFVESYLQGYWGTIPGGNSGPKILNDVIQAIPIVLDVTKNSVGTGMVTSAAGEISCNSICTDQQAAFPNGSAVTLTALADPGSVFLGWSGDCATLATNGGTNTTSITFPVSFDSTGNVIKQYPEDCTATFDVNVTVRLNVFGTQNFTGGPFEVQVLNPQLVPTTAPSTITVTLLRQVVSQCSGVLFSSDRTVVISQGQSVGGSLDAAGRDPACNTLPITTQWIVLQAVDVLNESLDLTLVPSSQLEVDIVR